ncbi:hypothetical protein BGZ65_000611 [Modicella reniformis]|uniref:Uncharacterized protein n=1 Tax=Modicella reniformis TaxID=1440133 RepID=A0A9P6M0B7_9FUNG|nr:hypothetical protein BGZ65_000611 [Modicella reniformis]
MDIFFERKETFAKDDAASNEAIDTVMKGLVDDVNKFLQEVCFVNSQHVAQTLCEAINDEATCSADAMVLEESARTSKESTSNEAVDHTIQELNGVTKCLRELQTVKVKTAVDDCHEFKAADESASSSSAVGAQTVHYE